MNGALEEQVRQRAYALWMDGGCVDGQALEYWKAAERELDAALTGRKAEAKTKRAAPKRAKSAATIGAGAPLAKPLATKTGRPGIRAKAGSNAGVPA